MQKVNTATFSEATPFEIHTPLMEQFAAHKSLREYQLQMVALPCDTFNKISSQVISRLYLKVAKKSHK